MQVVVLLQRNDEQSDELVDVLVLEIHNVEEAYIVVKVYVPKIVRDMNLGEVETAVYEEVVVEMLAIETFMELGIN